MRVEETDVVIVGGGVPGLVTAVEVFRRGLRARVLDREPGRATPAGAAVYQPRALAGFARLEIYDALRTRGAILERIRLHRAGAAEPQVTLDYAEIGQPFPHALALSD